MPTKRRTRPPLRPPLRREVVTGRSRRWLRPARGGVCCPSGRVDDRAVALRGGGEREGSGRIVDEVMEEGFGGIDVGGRIWRKDSLSLLAGKSCTPEAKDLLLVEKSPEARRGRSRRTGVSSQLPADHCEETPPLGEDKGGTC